jgi:hypothetical protein
LFIEDSLDVLVAGANCCRRDDGEHGSNKWIQHPGHEMQRDAVRVQSARDTAPISALGSALKNLMAVAVKQFSA